MNLHHLSIFHAIAETGSISASARRLHISQPALSRELKTFEARLGVTLFERMPRGMQLTQAGQVLYEHATRLFAIEHAAEAAVREVAEARSGRLTLGASNTIGTYVLPRILAGMRTQHPDIEVTLFVGNTEQVSRGVVDLRFMLGFIEGPLHVDGLAAVTFQEDELVPVVAAGDPLLARKRLHLEQVVRQPLLMRERGSGTREVITTLLRERGMDAPDRIMEFGNTEALKQAAIHGGGVAWLPRICMQTELRDGLLCELGLRSLHIRRPLKVLHRATAALAPLQHAFLERLQPGLGDRL
ncbi:LysR family transcriptional regulator [Oleiagrimonas soli]|uniref:DNA-binding transcriptional LysR family regulator n=1 Tax=Oleiagrimonas soli TaxID=1543381 RepID=A0A099CVB8_9GAMM|nr:LysR family transcriptional regulator [Oleiagrimonas soli]KGI77527.1 transcriptional regulator [Oleiagrimonas soli]MBB6183002.1 DNA-binding transcriptional LysR family regulator [Oleiagrimonas soli]